MAKSEDKVTEKDKGAFLCADCKTEFKGAGECPACGNAKGNIKLAADGIEQRAHKTNVLFSDVTRLRPADDILSIDNDFSTQTAAVQKAEMDNNLREIYVKRSEIKRMELDLQHLEKTAQLNAAKARLLGETPGGAATPRPGVPQNSQQPGDPGMYGSLPFMGMSPQTAFMSSLMKMDKEKRAEFLEQISEADPGALAAMSSMLNPAQMNPGMINGQMPPWMMWQQMMQMQQGMAPRQEVQPQSDPTESAINIVSSVIGLVDKLRPAQSTGITKEDIREILKEVTKGREENARARPDDMLKPVVSEIAELRSQVASLGRKDITSSVKEVKELVEGLVAVGLVQKAGSGEKTVEEELKIKKADFDMKQAEKKMALEESRAKAEQERTSMGKTVLQGLLQRSFLKNRKPDDTPVSKVSFVEQPRTVYQPPPQGVVVEEHATETGMIKELKSSKTENTVV